MGHTCHKKRSKRAAHRVKVRRVGGGGSASHTRTGSMSAMVQTRIADIPPVLYIVDNMRETSAIRSIRNVPTRWVQWASHITAKLRGSARRLSRLESPLNAPTVLNCLEWAAW